jgi:threonine dehydrogenase-like Zn-dependent dehydrogenase
MCLHGFTSRCSTSNLLGSPTLPGAQAQYIRIPNAGGSLIPALALTPQQQPHSQGLSPEDKLRHDALSLLLADVLPTGYFAAKQAWEHPNVSGVLRQIRDCPDEPRVQLAVHVAVLGLGPVGIVSLNVLGLCSTNQPVFSTYSVVRWIIAYPPRLGIGLLPRVDRHIRGRPLRQSTVTVPQDGRKHSEGAVGGRHLWEASTR